MEILPLFIPLENFACCMRDMLFFIQSHGFGFLTLLQDFLAFFQSKLRSVKRASLAMRLVRWGGSSNLVGFRNQTQNSHWGYFKLRTPFRIKKKHIPRKDQFRHTQNDCFETNLINSDLVGQGSVAFEGIREVRRRSIF